METIQLYECDCIAGMRALPEAFADCVVTSPPYNIGTQYSLYDDTGSRSRYLIFTGRWIQGVKRVLKPKGSFFLNVAGKPSDPWIPFDVAQVGRGSGLRLQNVIHWVKSITVEGATHGHFKPINSPRFVNNCHEYIFHFTHDGDTPLDRTAIGVSYQDPSNLRRWVGASRSQAHCRGDCWHLPYPTRKAKLCHPATFPEELVENCLKLHGLPLKDFRAGFQVLDPFVGIGTTALVAGRLGLSCLGFDIDPEYLTYAAVRVEAAHGIRCHLSRGMPE